jgi:hypothetical protein
VTAGATTASRYWNRFAEFGKTNRANRSRRFANCEFAPQISGCVGVRHCCTNFKFGDFKAEPSWQVDGCRVQNLAVFGCHGYADAPLWHCVFHIPAAGVEPASRGGRGEGRLVRVLVFGSAGQADRAAGSVAEGLQEQR